MITLAPKDARDAVRELLCDKIETWERTFDALGTPPDSAQRVPVAQWRAVVSWLDQIGIAERRECDDGE